MRRAKLTFRENSKRRSKKIKRCLNRHGREAKSVGDAYYNLALATTKRRGAAQNLQSAQEFESNTKLQLDAGEVAPVDLVRARLQTAQRRDELIQAQTEETVAADALKF